MKQKVIAVLALPIFISLLFPVKAQDNVSDTTWPFLGIGERLIDPAKPRFNIEQHKLKSAPNEPDPLAQIRCRPSATGRAGWIGDFFLETKGSMKENVLCPGVVMHHYRAVLFEHHHLTTGTYVFYLPKQQVFYLWGDCGMGHADMVAGPFAGDPRLVLKKLADDPDSVALLGMLTVPFQAVLDHNASDQAWPAIPLVPRTGIDISKLEKANELNPLSLDRCRPPASCATDMRDFSSKRRNQSGKDIWVLRRDVVVHYYPSIAIQDAERPLRTEAYVFYLPAKNIFYLGGYALPPGDGNLVLGPFAGDPRVVLKKFAAASK